MGRSSETQALRIVASIPHPDALGVVLLHDGNEPFNFGQGIEGCLMAGCAKGSGRDAPLGALKDHGEGGDVIVGTIPRSVDRGFARLCGTGYQKKKNKSKHNKVTIHYRGINTPYTGIRTTKTRLSTT